ncbi:GNAT family N-acetyltransferase [Pseudonocardia sp. RS11V-5]|uniref:GNAT family N-acetyltransferase n=1 Tax=Pseudonocardia terrae TaxID=2905831 RepID=UPI001E29B35A|nr:GNAT family N-acetyltransferase [Pseudonocardia terrae]MCE3552275.1 GNAT family N-acetyltransferase [Pseudonocardia terrae]
MGGLAPVLDPTGLEAAFADLWVGVTRAGGAVGFPPDAPEGEIRDLAGATLAEVRAGRLHMLALRDGAALVGTAFLQPGAGPVVAHRATVLRLMIHPDRQRQGLGGRLLAAAVGRARELGFGQLLLSARGGTGLPGFYTGQGWTEVGRFPRALRLGADDVRDEHWFQLEIGPGPRNRRESVGPAR